MSKAFGSTSGRTSARIRQILAAPGAPCPASAKADDKLNTAILKKYSILAVLACSLLTAAVAHADTVYVSDSHGGIIEISSTGVVSNLNTSGEALAGNEGLGLAIDSSGNLYYSNPSGNIYKINPYGVVSTFASGGSNFDPVGDLAIDSSGNLYATDRTYNAIDEITPNGVISKYATVDDPTNLAIDSGGNLYVSGLGGVGDSILEIPSGGGGVSVYANEYPYGGATGLAFDTHGNLFVANQEFDFSGLIPNNITEIGSGGVGLFASGLDAPQDIAFDSSGNLWVVNGLSSTVDEFAPNGTLVNSYGQISAIFGIAIGPTLVPEPSAIALLSLCGLGLLRRQRGRTANGPLA